MQILSPTPEHIEIAAGIIRDGGIAAFPTETVYGLGADAFNPQAAAKIFEAKDRPFFDPLIVHVPDVAAVSGLVSSLPAAAEKLMQKFWPGPLTIVLPKNHGVPGIVTAGLSTVAVRMPAHPVALAFIRAAGRCIAAPSANRFGCLSPTNAEHVRDQLGDRVPVILDGGACVVGVESTIIKIENDAFHLLRPGGVPVEEIERIVGRVQVAVYGALTEAPGQLPYHYAPSTPVALIERIEEYQLEDPDAVFLFFREPLFAIPAGRCEVLSPSGSISEAAANLFSGLHRLDGLHKKIIYAEEVPSEGLGRAIMDRLVKASKRRRQG